MAGNVRVLAVCFALAAPAVAPTGAGAQTGEGYRIVRTPLAYPVLVERTTAAIAKNGMNLVTRASASEGASGRGLTIKGDAVLGIYRNDFAVRMLDANVDAAIEAPIRLHLVEEPDGGSTIRYHLPSFVFGRYEGEAIRALGRELDPIFAAIVADAIRP